MSSEPLLVEQKPPDPQERAAFKDWLRRYITEPAELRAFDAGEIDAVMDPTSRSAVLLPEARVALQEGSDRLVVSTLDALPGQVCVLDAAATVILTNRAWREFASSRAGNGLKVNEGTDFFVACRDVVASERAQAATVAAGLRQVLEGSRNLFRCEYVCQPATERCSYTLTIARASSGGSVRAVVTRETVAKGSIASTTGRSARTKARAPAVPREGASNRLLASLPARAYERLLGALDRVELAYGDVLNEPGEQMRHVYFPSDCLVSLLTVVEGHQALEVGLVGREGVVGSRLALGITTSPVRALVQGGGTALRMKSTHFVLECRRTPALQQAVLQFTDSLMVQVTRTAACNRFHVIEERLARWLLMTRERLLAPQFRLTQEFLADMLGVRRVGVTEAAGALQRRKLIHYRRGIITILDQRGLEAACCSCYGHVRLALVNTISNV
ncbi:MAG: Crp/Fnr family transcriptional regulator [Steroidobacteraceae bacterium]